MNTQEIIENNKLIASWLGYKLITPTMRKNPSRWVNSYWEKEDNDGKIIVLSEEKHLKFHNSYQHLMPVIEKIQFHSGCIVEINYALVVTCRICYLGKNKYDKGINFYGDNNGGEEPIMAIYKCVVEFLKFLENENNKK